MRVCSFVPDDYSGGVFPVVSSFVSVQVWGRPLVCRSTEPPAPWT
jgi:hypothetical protein